MCGIVGLFLKEEGLKPRLGELLAGMLVTMTDRGPDSGGVAIYGDGSAGWLKLTVQSDAPERDFPDLEARLADVTGTRTGAQAGTRPSMRRVGGHAVLVVASGDVETVRALLSGMPGMTLVGTGERMEIFKDVGRPASVVERLGLRDMAGSHGIGHTRMATESAVTTNGAHPFSTGADQCLVHNGSLSNHNSLRRRLAREGIATTTDNDTEVAAAYLTWRMREGDGLAEALDHSLSDLDGFFTFVVGTRTGFGVLRDPIACKPAVLAETDGYVAFGSEYRAFAGLPGIGGARVWEPEPATVYFWER